MTADIENLVLEHLPAIRAELAELKREVASNSAHLATLEQQVERIERRLELSDAPGPLP